MNLYKMGCKKIYNYFYSVLNKPKVNIDYDEEYDIIISNTFYH